MERQRRLAIFRDGVAGNTTHFVEVAPPQHGGRSAEIGGVPEIEAFLFGVIEHIVLGRHAPERPQEIPIDRVGTNNEMRRLYEKDLLIQNHPRHGAVEKVDGGNVVGVKNDDQVAIGFLQRMIDVPGLGVLVPRARVVMDAETGAQCLQFVSPLQGGPCLRLVRIVDLLVGPTVVE
jgi:hypothetical protein